MLSASTILLHFRRSAQEIKFDGIGIILISIPLWDLINFFQVLNRLKSGAAGLYAELKLDKINETLYR